MSGRMREMSRLHRRGLPGVVGKDARMSMIEYCLEVARPVAMVWDVWSDVRRLPELSKSTVAVHDAPARLTEVGQTFRQVAGVAGRTTEVTWTVADIEPMHHVTIESAPAMGARVRITESVRATAPDRTCLTLSIEYRLPFGPFGRLASKLGLEKIAQREAHEVLQGVARLVESLAADPVGEVALRPGAERQRIAPADPGGRGPGRRRAG
jgi:uncharacterized membrane protein